MGGLYVALGDSYTEGVGDWNVQLPNGVRGFADRVAAQLGLADPAWRYANLAVRSKFLFEVLTEQVPRAVELAPSLVTFQAGLNDLMVFRADPRAVFAAYDAAVEALSAPGRTVVLYTGYDLRPHPLIEVIRHRNREFNERIRAIARARGAVLVDVAAAPAFAHPALWASDRLHPSALGHRELAAATLDALGVRHRLRTMDPLGRPLPLPRRRTTGSVARAARREWQWVADWAGPWLARQRRGVRLGDRLRPRWPEPVRPAAGLRRLARARQEDLLPHVLPELEWWLLDGLLPPELRRDPRVIAARRGLPGRPRGAVR